MTHIILDIDNCVADDGWRIRYIEWEKKGDARYHEYHRRAGYDFAKNRFVLTEKHPTEVVLFMTGRPNRYRQYTDAWLRKNVIGKRPFELIMRNDGDARSAVQLKQEMLLRWLPHYGVEIRNITGAYDDRADIVEMYKSHGIPAHVLSIHNKDAYRDTPQALPEGNPGPIYAGRVPMPGGQSVPLEHGRAVDL